MAALLLALVCLACVGLTGCGGSAEGETSGPAWQQPKTPAVCEFSRKAMGGSDAAGIDTSHVNQGYVGALGKSSARLKLVVSCGNESYNYDIPTDGTPAFAPLNMGSGSYTFIVMRNTSGNRYVSLYSTSAKVSLESEFAPFLVPSVYCSYGKDSACVGKARELCEGAGNQGDVVAAVYTWITDNITYDEEKASRLANSTGYVPSPDKTLQAGKGVCFDYASLAAAMLRSQGIPCKIVTGYVSPDGIYHAWNEVYIDGSWQSVEVTVDARKWSRIDTTFGASNGGNTRVGDGKEYTDRFVY